MLLTVIILICNGSIMLFKNTFITNSNTFSVELSNMVSIDRYNPHTQKLFKVLYTFYRYSEWGSEMKKSETC